MLKKIIAVALGTYLMLVPNLTSEVFGVSSSKIGEYGAKVARLQNAYSQHLANADEYEVVFKSLSVYFDKDSQDFCRSWLGIDSWYFATRYLTGSSTENVLWLAKDEGGNIIAFSSAVYDRESETFKDVSLHTLGR